MEYLSIKLNDLIKNSNNKELLLPNFQRDFVWDRPMNQRRLLTSILYDIPIGSLLILEGPKDYFATKELCISNESSTSLKDTCQYLLDGQQRLSTLKSIFYDFFEDIHDWKNTYDKLYQKLITRWFIKIIPDETTHDLFGWKNLNFNKTFLNSIEPSDIKKIIKYEKFGKNQSHLWYHPEYKIEDWIDKENGKIKKNQKNLIIAREAAGSGYIPLYSIYNSEDIPHTKKLHYRVLKNIATNRLEELKALISDNPIILNDIFTEKIQTDSVDELLEDLKDNWINDVCAFLDNIIIKEVPIIQLQNDEMSRAIHTFEFVNEGGTALSVYDLIVAKAAQDRGLDSLTNRIINLIKNDIYLTDSLLRDINVSHRTWDPVNMGVIKEGMITNIIKNQYLNLLSIYSNTEYLADEIKLELIKKDKLLQLTHKQINSSTEIIIKALMRACAFLHFRCGITNIDIFNYDLMIIPISYILIKDEWWEDEVVINKLEYWYWVSLFGGSYRESQNNQCIEDIKKLVKLVKDEINDLSTREANILEFQDYSDKNTLLLRNESKKVPPAIDKGILQYILSKQPKDFIDSSLIIKTWDIAEQKEFYFQSIEKNETVKIEDHHIIPLGTVTKIGESTKSIRKNPTHILNSPLNRTYISSISNRVIRDKTTKEYFNSVSDISIYDHCIPANFTDIPEKNTNESDNEYYGQILEKRYLEIKRDITEKIDNLKRKFTL